MNFNKTLAVYLFPPACLRKEWPSIARGVSVMRAPGQMTAYALNKVVVSSEQFFGQFRAILFSNVKRSDAVHSVTSHIRKWNVIFFSMLKTSRYIDAYITRYYESCEIVLRFRPKVNYETALPEEKYFFAWWSTIYERAVAHCVTLTRVSSSRLIIRRYRSV